MKYILLYHQTRVSKRQSQVKVSLQGVVVTPGTVSLMGMHNSFAMTMTHACYQSLFNLLSFEVWRLHLFNSVSSYRECLEAFLSHVKYPSSLLEGGNNEIHCWWMPYNQPAPVIIGHIVPRGECWGNITCQNKSVIWIYCYYHPLSDNVRVGVQGCNAVNMTGEHMLIITGVLTKW